MGRDLFVAGWLSLAALSPAKVASAQGTAPKAREPLQQIYGWCQFTDYSEQRTYFTDVFRTENTQAFDTVPRQYLADLSRRYGVDSRSEAPNCEWVSKRPASFARDAESKAKLTAILHNFRAVDTGWSPN